jgi:hypothetical protein
MHLVSAEYGNQRDKCMNIHTRDVIVLKYSYKGCNCVKDIVELVILAINDEAY